MMNQYSISCLFSNLYFHLRIPCNLRCRRCSWELFLRSRRTQATSPIMGSAPLMARHLSLRFVEIVPSGIGIHQNVPVRTTALCTLMHRQCYWAQRGCPTCTMFTVWRNSDLASLARGSCAAVA